jgi:hypothetical protein
MKSTANLRTALISAIMGITLISCDKPGPVAVAPQDAVRPRMYGEGQVQLQDGALQRLAGKWTGELEYLDFGNNQTKSRIRAALKCDYASATRTLAMKVSFREPDGKTIEDEASFVVSEDGRKLTFEQAEWDVTKVEAPSDSGNLTLIFERTGADNQREADLKNTVVLDDAGRLIVTKEVRYKTGGQYFVRSIYQFARTVD